MHLTQEQRHATLKMTKLLSLRVSHTFGALAFISQYGHGSVQKLTAWADAPSGVSSGTDKEKVPLTRCACRRVARADRCSAPAVTISAEDEKKVRSSIEEKVCAKSVGVTSDTNHGISLGLRDEKQVQCRIHV